jgi:formate C-acetyltransferase
MLKHKESLQKLKALIMTYFENGGLQIQATIADQDALKKAMAEPDKYSNLMIRIGGYSEYFNRLSDELKKELIKRTVQEI